MTIEDEIAYWRQRELEERAAAGNADTIETHDAHFVMAERYADRVFSLTERVDELARISRPKPKLRAIS